MVRCTEMSRELGDKKHFHIVPTQYGISVISQNWCLAPPTLPLFYQHQSTWQRVVNGLKAHTDTIV